MKWVVYLVGKSRGRKAGEGSRSSGQGRLESAILQECSTSGEMAQDLYNHHPARNKAVLIFVLLEPTAGLEAQECFTKLP